MPNRLAAETSPYLLQHKDNPVDWYPWGDEALGRARDENKPIFLSIGYAACHWCHVMEHESFEDPETAALMNDLFVNIKVDREERPDIDAIYMDAVQALTGRGGWPMSMFLSPDGAPFYGGTYYPPDRRHGMPSFREVLGAVAESWDQRGDDLREHGSKLIQAIASATRPAPSPVAGDTLAVAVDAIQGLWDTENAGLGSGTKFPQAMLLEFLLRAWVGGAERESTLDLVTASLDTMAARGLYDHLGGGFHRYCVDAAWTVPHFEKMLYDNALLVPVYLHAYLITGSPAYERIARDTLDYMARELRQDCGGLSSSQDADSLDDQGILEEGAFFAWTPAQIREVLGDELGSRACAYFGLTESGNFEHGTSVLHVADESALGVDEFADARARLFEARKRRSAPATDDKVLASWNGLALAAFAEAARVFDDDGYLEVARGIAAHVDASMTLDQRLLHSWREGKAQIPGFADDYAALAVGLIELFAATGDEAYFLRAVEYVEVLLAHFGDPDGGFFTTADDAEELVVRPKDLMDNAVPSANSLAADACARLALLTGDARYEDAARETLAVTGKALGPQSQAFGRALSVLALLDSSPVEIAIVGDTDRTLGRIVAGKYLPFSVMAAGDGTSATRVPLLEDRHPVDAKPAAYLCRDFACQAPITDPAELQAALS